MSIIGFLLIIVLTISVVRFLRMYYTEKKKLSRIEYFILSPKNDINLLKTKVKKLG